MSTVKRGIRTVAGEYWRHLRPWLKRRFWKGERRTWKHLITRGTT